MASVWLAWDVEPCLNLAMANFCTVLMPIIIIIADEKIVRDVCCIGETLAGPMSSACTDYFCL